MSSRAWAKGFLGKTLWPISRHVLRRQSRGSKGLILMFHHIGSSILPGASEDLFLCQDEFVKILDFIQTEFQPLEPREFLEKLSLNQLPPRATMLTFDDGTLDNVTLALPELKKRNLKACFFVCPGLIESKASIPTLELLTTCSKILPGKYNIEINSHLVPGISDLKLAIEINDQESQVRAYQRLGSIFLRSPSRNQPLLLDNLRKNFKVSKDLVCSYPLADWNDLKNLQNAGMIIGNHTLYHSTVSADGINQFTRDVQNAFEILESRFPQPMKLFCYSYGRREDATQETTAWMKKEGVDFAFVTQGGLATTGTHGRWLLRREEASYSLDAIRLIPLIASWRTLYG